MVDEIRDVTDRPAVPTNPDREAVDNAVEKGDSKLSPDGQPKNLIPRQQGKKTHDTFGEVARLLQRLRSTTPERWRAADFRALREVAKNVIEAQTQAVKAAARIDDYAVEAAANAARTQLRAMINALNPPPAITDGEEYQSLMALLWPPSMDRGGNKFSMGSNMRGSVKTEVKQQLVTDALLAASKRAGEKMLKQQGEKQGSEAMNQMAKMSLEQMSRFIQRKSRALKKGRVLNAHGELEDMTEEEKERERRELQELMELFSQRALETMKVIREEIAPKWAPEQQAWLLQAADTQVFAILLAAADKSMLEATQAWDALQDLRDGQAVFTLRAADKLTEATRRGFLAPRREGEARRAEPSR